MDTRRDFLKKAALLTGGVGVTMAFPPSIQKALAINPDEGTSFEDAEHVVLLMQENRSFDHCFGTLKGVRGYNDPRAIALPDKNPVWMQRNSKGETYVPFGLNMQETKATWMGDLPHSWENQVDAVIMENTINGWLQNKPGEKHIRTFLLRSDITTGKIFRFTMPLPMLLRFRPAFLLITDRTTTNRLFSGAERTGHPNGIAHVRELGGVLY